MKTVKWSVLLIGTVLIGINSALFAQPVELPSPKEIEKIILPKIEIENRQPIWTLDGKEIAYLSNKDCENKKQFNLYFINPTNAKLRKFPLTNGQKKEGLWKEYCNFSFSPDGKKIAFVFNDCEPSSDFLILKFPATDIHIANLDGTNQRNLTQQNEWKLYKFISWSPDGTKICYSEKNENYEIKIMDANGKFVYKLAENAIQPIWSPDGKKILFLKERINKAVFIIDIDGKNEKTISCGQELITIPYQKRMYWSPDGQNILVESDDKVYAYAIDNTKDRSEWVAIVNGMSLLETVQKLDKLYFATNEINSSISSDGKKFIFNQDGDIWKTTIVQYNFPLENETVNLTNTEEIKEEEPCWSPDGKQIAFVRDYEIWVMDFDGSNQKQLTFERTTAIKEAMKKYQEKIKTLEKTFKETIENEK